MRQLLWHMTDMSVLKLADLRTVATKMFSIERGDGSWVSRVPIETCTVQLGSGMQLSRIGEQLPCTREPGNRNNPFAVAVMRSSVTVSQQLVYERSIVQVCTSARTISLIVRDGGSIRQGVANQNPQSAKIISAKFCKKVQSAKMLSLKNLALYNSCDL